MKGVALIREYNGDIYEAVIHWFEAHGVGKRALDQAAVLQLVEQAPIAADVVVLQVHR